MTYIPLQKPLGAAQLGPDSKVAPTQLDYPVIKAGIAAIVPPPAAGDTQTFLLAHTGTFLPNLLYSLDAALPAGPNAVPDGTAGIQVAANGDVIEMVEPVSKVRVTHGYGYTRRILGGAGGLPYFQSNNDSTNNGYDALVMPVTAGRALFTPANGTWTVMMVIRQTGGNANGLLTVRGSANVTVLGSSSTDGSLYVEQNNGGAVGNEPTAAAQAFNQLQVLTILCDGLTISLFRNGLRTLQTAEGTIGGVTIDTFEFLNNAQAQVACILVAAGTPSKSQHNSEVARLGADHGITVSTVVDGPVNALPPVPIDNTATFLATPNFPTSDILPTRTDATPGAGITLTSGASQMFSLVFGSGQTSANVTTGQRLRELVYMNYFSGTQTQVFGNPIDSGQGDDKPFYAVARHYAVGDPYDVHVVATDGLHLKGFASNNGQTVAMGQVWAGMIRLPAVFRPGCTIKVRYKTAKGNYSWPAIWMFTGEQRTPGPGGDPYQGFNTITSLIRESNKPNHEIDWNDNYSRFSEGTPTGRQLNFGCPDRYGATWATSAPYTTYKANGVGVDGRTYVAYENTIPPYLDLGADLSTGFHELIGNWRNDGSNKLDVLIDGKLVQSVYMEYGNAGTYVDQNGATQTIGMHLIIGNQAVPTFAPGYGSTTDNDGLPEGWSIVVQEISAWRGNVLNVNGLKAVP